MATATQNGDITSSRRETSNDVSQSNSFAKILHRCFCPGYVASFLCPPRLPQEMPYEVDKMKRSASASFEKDVSKNTETEHLKKITKSVEPKKLTAKPHDDIDEYPSPIRVKKDIHSATKPLVPVTVNDAPTEKELAAAKAARVRLGYEKPDDPSTTHQETNIVLKCPTDPEPVTVVEVEYIPTDDLKPLENVDVTLESLVSELQTKDWTEMCQALNRVRQLTIHHPTQCIPLLSELVPAVLKLFKNPRSSVCKTAVMCFGDMVHSLRNEMFQHLDVGGPKRPANNVLSQLLLKASTDKQFVAEEIQKVLTVLGQELDVIKLSTMLAPYAAEHKNPKVRGKAGMMLASVSERMTSAEWKENGLESLLKVAAVLVTDKTPDAREAARRMIMCIHTIFQEELTTNTQGMVDAVVNVNISIVDKSATSDTKPCEEEEPYLSDSSDEDEETKPSSSSPWKLFCEEHLTTTQVIAVLKVQAS